MMFFSATYEKKVMEFAEYIVPNPITIRLRKEEEALDNIMQYYVKCRDQDQKYQAISNLYGVITIGQAIIFCHVNIFQDYYEFLIILLLVLDSKNCWLVVW